MPRFNVKLRILIVTVLILSLIAAGCAASGASSYPNKNIEIICPYSAGGGSDLFSRGVADGFKDAFPKITTIVTNKTGGNGQVGGAYAKSKTSDPYTLLSANSGDIGGWMDLEVDYFDFQPIAVIAYDVNVLLVKAVSPYNTMKDLVDAAKKEPKNVIFGGTIIGSTDQILCKLLIDQTGITSKYVPFEGGGEVSSALLGGHITAAWSNPSEAIKQIEAGKLKALAVASKNRLASMPNVPTTVESGFESITFGQFRGMLVGKGTDPAIVTKLADAMKKVSESAAFKEYAAKRNWVVTYEGPDAMKKTIEDQDKTVRAALGKPAVDKYNWN